MAAWAAGGNCCLNISWQLLAAAQVAMQVGRAALLQLATSVWSGELCRLLSAHVKNQLVAAAQAAGWSLPEHKLCCERGHPVDANAWGWLGRRADDAGHTGEEVVLNV